MRLAGGRLAFGHDGRRYFAPRRIDDLAALCAQFPEACLLAGGTDVGLWVTKQHRDLDTAIHSLEETGTGDQLQLRRLKKMKLDIKDKIQVIENMLIPHIIA